MLHVALIATVASFYALFPSTSPVWSTLLIAVVSLSLKAFLAGYTTHLVAKLFRSSSAYIDELFGLANYSVAVVVLPFAALVVGELVVARVKTPSFGTYASIFACALSFALAGIAQERAGVGRSVWWIRHADAELRWMASVGGPVLVDFVFASFAFALFERATSRLVDSDARKTRVKKALSIVVFFFALNLLSPLMPSFPFRHCRPIPDDPSFIYPPVKVGCVALPTLGGKGARDGDGKEGWEGMAKEEQELLRRAGEVCDNSKVHVLVTYSIRPRQYAPRHHRLNIATLVGPRARPEEPRPNVVFSTTKHNPVPFIESYSHSDRVDAVLRSSPAALPLGRIKLPHPPHTPWHLVPFETVDVSAAICQDVAFPSLVASYLAVDASSPAKTPQLILNPSDVPTSSLAESQTSQARARAIEQRASILRCDGAEGISSLTGPDGEVRTVVNNGEEGWTSWEGYVDVDVERASGRTGFARRALGGSSALGSEVATLFWIALAVTLVGVVESGVFNPEMRARMIEKVKAGWEWLSNRGGEIVAAEADEGRITNADEHRGTGASSEGGAEGDDEAGRRGREQRLIEV
ncbi:hypothetical protein JCM10212_001848 [Sporobolomyces blumeae]